MKVLILGELVAQVNSEAAGVRRFERLLYVLVTKRTEGGKVRKSKRDTTDEMGRGGRGCRGVKEDLGETKQRSTK